MLNSSSVSGSLPSVDSPCRFCRPCHLRTSAEPLWTLHSYCDPLSTLHSIHNVQQALQHPEQSHAELRLVQGLCCYVQYACD